MAALGGMAVVIQLRMMFFYSEDAIPRPDTLQRLAMTSGSVVKKREEDNVTPQQIESKSSDCSECNKKPKAPEWWDDEKK